MAISPLDRFMEHWRAARRTATPIVAIQTADPASTYKRIVHDEPKCPMMIWDRARGLIPANEPYGKQAVEMLMKLLPGTGPKASTMLANPLDMLQLATQMPKESVLFMLNLHRFLKEPSVVQAVWNLRDLYKTDTRTLAILCPFITLPPEISSDVLILDEPLPDNAQLETIVMQTYEAVNLPFNPQKSAKDNEMLSRAVDALCGLAAFPAEQRSAMSIHGDTVPGGPGLNIEELWEGKLQAISQTQGLSISRNKVKFNAVTGLSNCKQYHVLRGKGPERRRGVIFIDEIDKHMAGFGAVGTGDTTTEMVGALLTDMQEHEAEGSLFLGVPGAGKTLIATAIANEWDVPCVNFDLSGMKGSLVGQSGENIRNALKVVHAITQGNPYYIATCNRIENLPGELRRRFTNSTFFFDLPTKAEREASWDLYEKKFKVGGERPEDMGWTAAEIRNCCYNAHILGSSLLEAAQYIVPLAKSQQTKQVIEQLRKSADGSYISASYPGFYKAPEGIQDAEYEQPEIIGVVATLPRRKIRTEGSGGTGSKGAN